MVGRRPASCWRVQSRQRVRGVTARKGQGTPSRGPRQGLRMERSLSALSEPACSTGHTALDQVLVAESIKDAIGDLGWIAHRTVALVCLDGAQPIHELGAEGEPLWCERTGVAVPEHPGARLGLSVHQPITSLAAATRSRYSFPKSSTAGTWDRRKKPPSPPPP